jgi:hypothetical protein
MTPSATPENYTTLTDVTTLGLAGAHATSFALPRTVFAAK